MAAKKTASLAETPSKHRTAPIASSITPVPNYPAKLVIYQLTASPYWWVRYYVDKRIARRSTKTTDKRKAFTFAKDFYDEINYKRRQGLSITSQSKFQICADAVMEAQEQRVKLGVVDYTAHFNNRLSSFTCKLVKLFNILSYR